MAKEETYQELLIEIDSLRAQLKGVENSGEHEFEDGQYPDAARVENRVSSDRRREDRWISGLNQINEQLLVHGDFNDKMMMVTEGVVEHFQADFCRIWIINEGDRCDLGCVHAKVTKGPHVCRNRDRCLHLIASTGRYAHLDGELHSRVPFGSYKIGRVAAGEDGKFITNDVTNDLGIHDHEWARALGLESFAGYRLTSPEGKILGVLALFSQHRILPREDTLLESLAKTVSHVILSEEIQQNLREREARYRALFESAVDAIHVSNEKDEILEVNDRMCALMGYTREELLSMTVSDLQAPEVRIAPGNIVANEVSQYQVSVFESLNIHKDGTLFPVEISVSKVETSSGDLYYCNLRDISNRKQAEKIILEWQSRYQFAVQASGHLLYDWDSVSNEVTYGGALHQMLGYSFDELKGGLTRWIELIHPDDIAHFNYVIEQLVATKEKAQLEYRVRRKDGAYIHVEDSGNFIGDEKTRMVGFVKDISERIRAKQLLQEEEMRYRTLFTESPIVLWEEDLSEVKIYIDELRSQGVEDWRSYFQDNIPAVEECLRRVKILNINMSALDFYEAGSIEQLISGLDKLFTEESFVVFQEELAALAEGDTYFESEVQTITFTGKPLFALMRVTVPKGYEQTWEKVFVSALDISERIEAEEIIKASEARYRSLFENSPIEIWEQDQSGIKAHLDTLIDQGVRDFQKYFKENPAEVFKCMQMIKVIGVNPAALEKNLVGSLDELFENSENLMLPESLEAFRDQLVTLVEGNSTFIGEVVSLNMAGETTTKYIQATIPPGFEDQWERVYVTSVDITAQKQAEEILKRRTDEMSALHAVTLDLTTPTELEPILESIVARATELLDGSSGGLYLCDAENQEVRCAVNYKTEFDFTGTILEYGEGAAGFVAESEQPHIVDDYRTWEGRAKIFDGEESFQAILSVPIFWQTQIRGVLHIMRDVEDLKFNQEDFELLKILANHAAIAIENARLMQQIQVHADKLEDRVHERTQELRTIVNAMAGREVRMAELKVVIKQLRRQIKSLGMVPIADDPLNLEL